MATNTCITTPEFSSAPTRIEVEIPEGELPSVKRALADVRDLRVVADEVSDGAWAELVQRKAYASELAHTVVLNPRAARNRGVMMRRLMNWFYDPADPKNIRTFFRRAKRRGASLIDSLPLLSGSWALDSSRLNLSRNIRELWEGSRDIMRRAGIKDSRTMGEVFVRTVEEGSSRYTDNLVQGKVARHLLQQRTDRYLKYMREMGFNDADITKLREIADGYIAADEIAYRSAQAAGLEIGEESGIGFFNRVFTPEARRSIREQKIEFLEEMHRNHLENPRGSSIRSRVTFDYTVEDELAFAEALGWTEKRGITRRRQRLDTYNEKVETYRGHLNAGDTHYNQATLDQMVAKAERMQSALIDEMEAPLQRVAEVVNDEGMLMQEIAKLDEATLNRLIDEGIMDKIPMSSHRVYEVLAQRYNLPFNGLDEMMVTNPIRAHQMNLESLQNGLKNSVLTQNMVRGAFEEGWAVRLTDVQANPARYGEYIPMSEVLQKQEHGLDLGNYFPNPEQYRNMMVHPDVARAYVAALDFSTNEGALHSFLRAFHTIQKNTMLTSAGFVVKNLYGVMVNGWQAGANMITYPQTLTRMHHAVLRGNYLDAFDNTVRRYRGGNGRLLTQQELYLELVQKGVIDSRNLIGESIQLGGDARQLLNLRGAARRLRYIKHQLGQGNVGGAVVRGIDAVGELTDNILAPLLFETTMLEDAMKLQAAMTYLDDNGITGATRIPAQLFGGAGFQRFDNVDDAIHELHQHFIDYEDTTSFDRFMRTNLIPFWMYTSRNIPLQVRYMMRHPGRFMGYYRLYQVLNTDAQQRGEDFPVSGANQWMMDGMPVYIRGKDETTWWSTPTELYDPIMEGFSFMTKEFTANTPQEQVEDLMGENSTGQRVLDYFLNQTYGDIKTVMAAITGEDPFTGAALRQEDSFLGLPVPSIGGLPAGLTVYALEQVLPYARQLNRSNPGGIFGVREMRDAEGRVVRAARASIFGISRYDRDPHILGRDEEAPILTRVARYSGIPLYETDVVRNVQGAHDFYNRAQREFQTEANRALEEAQAATTDAEAEAKYSEWLVRQAMSDEMATWADRIDIWLLQRGQVTGATRREIETIYDQMKAREARRGDGTETNRQ